MDEVYRKYAMKVYLYLYSLCSDKDLSEELMQETFYSAIKSINSFRGDCNISVWLCQIAKNKLIDEIKKRKRVNFIELDKEDNIDILNLIMQSNEVEEKLINKEEMSLLYKKINELTEVTKQIVLLRIKLNLSFKEIGKIYGKSEGWARMAFYRAKIKLKEEMEDEV